MIPLASIRGFFPPALRTPALEDEHAAFLTPEVSWWAARPTHPVVQIFLD